MGPIIAPMNTVEKSLETDDLSKPAAIAPDLETITLVLGLDAAHLEELRWTWPTWELCKPEVIKMRLIVFYDARHIDPAGVSFLNRHPRIRWIPWEMPDARDQREKMLTGYIHVPARYVETAWYLKLDTDAVATGSGEWLKNDWLEPDSRGRVAVFTSAKWSYSKPRYVIDVLDDWGDRIQGVSRYPRLDIPYSSASVRVKHRRIISWFFLGNTEWTQKVAEWLQPTGRMPWPSQDTFLFYCAKRTRRRMNRERMSKYHWAHTSLWKIKGVAANLGCQPASIQPTALLP